MTRAWRHLGLDQRPAINGEAIACEFNGPLTALLLYMNELKQQSHQLSNDTVGQVHLKEVIGNALKQVERLCVITKKIAAKTAVLPATALSETAWEPCGKANDRIGASNVLMLAEAGGKPLTKREHEVLNLISEGYSNKQGAFRMGISPRTFESHRAEIMRKLGARNTADLMRTILSQARIDESPK